ncbi:MAG: recombination protein RecO [Campylobacter sp.]
MQGYIIHTQKVKEEDLIVYILSPNLLIKSYRFYGARHPSVLQGYKIDFELIENINFLPQLRSVLHLGFKWLLSRDKLMIWQQFMRLVYAHLKDVEIVDEAYFNELEFCAKRFEKGNAKRLIIQSYIRLLQHEGRLHDELNCFICDEKITNNVALSRSFLPAHESCISQRGFAIAKIQNLFETKNTILLDDNNIEELYAILLQGF